MTRSDLYALVWKKPVRVLAPMLGLSDVGLAKLCRRHEVPVPGRGFWAKKAAGRAVRVDTLPRQGKDEVIPELRSIVIREYPQAEARWLVPGLLRAEPPIRPGVDVERLRVVLLGDEGEAPQGLTASAASRPKRAPRVSPLPAVESPASTAALPSAVHATGESGADLSDEAPQMRANPQQKSVVPPTDGAGQLDFILAAALENAQRQAAIQLLRDVAAMAIDEELEVGRAIFDAVARLRNTIGDQSEAASLVNVMGRRWMLALSPAPNEVDRPEDAVTATARDGRRP